MKRTSPPFTGDDLPKAKRRLQYPPVCEIIAVQIGFQTLAETAAEKSLVGWINEHFGEIKRDGKSFDQMPVFLAEITGLVRL